jgi:hypothetical protein
MDPGMPAPRLVDAVVENRLAAEKLRRRARDVRGHAALRRREAASAALGGQRRRAEGLLDAAAWLDATAARDEALAAAAERSGAERWGRTA